MGVHRLATLPDTVPWRRVIQLLAEDADAATVADATFKAAVKGFNEAKCDTGLVHSFFGLSQIVLAARTGNFVEGLQRIGISLVGPPTIFDLVSGYSELVETYDLQCPGRTDFSEMGFLAAVASLTSLLYRRSAGLYGTTFEDIRAAAYRLSTKQGFGGVTEEFFARFYHRFLTYHLGRELSLHVGPNARFANAADLSNFVEEIEAHCREVAGVLSEFAPQWYSKHRFHQTLNISNTEGFVNHALTKLGEILLERRNRRG